MARPILNTELILEAPKRIADGGGGHQIVWSPVGTLWAEIRPGTARERLVGGREVSEISHRITIRAAPVSSPRRPTPDCRFRSGVRIFAIRGVAEADPRGQYLTCWAEEGVAT